MEDASSSEERISRHDEEDGQRNKETGGAHGQERQLFRTTVLQKDIFPRRRIHWFWKLEAKIREMRRKLVEGGVGARRTGGIYCMTLTRICGFRELDWEIEIERFEEFHGTVQTQEMGVLTDGALCFSTIWSFVVEFWNRRVGNVDWKMWIQVITKTRNVILSFLITCWHCHSSPISSIHLFKNNRTRRVWCQRQKRAQVEFVEKQRASTSNRIGSLHLLRATDALWQKKDHFQSVHRLGSLVGHVSHWIFSCLK